MLVPLEDGESWNLKPTAAADGPRFAHITISERGYYSIDRPGTVRGPYVTLSEAADPLARHDAELLGPAEVRTPAAPPLRLGTTPSAPSGRAWSRDLVIVLVTVGVLAAGRRLMGGTRR